MIIQATIYTLLNGFALMYYYHSGLYSLVFQIHYKMSVLFTNKETK